MPGSASALEAGCGQPTLCLWSGSVFAPALCCTPWRNTSSGWRAPDGRPVAGPRRVAPSMPAGRERGLTGRGAVTGATPRRSLGAFIPAVGRRWPRRSRQARKAAKATRYATEPARASLGKPAKRSVSASRPYRRCSGPSGHRRRAGCPAAPGPGGARGRRARFHLGSAVRPGASRGQKARTGTAGRGPMHRNPGCAKHSFTERSLTSRLAGRE